LISWTFPTNGARQRVHEAEASSQVALAKFDGVVLTALRETETNLATYASDYARADSLRAALKSAAETADETHRLYRAGRESFIDDLDATRTLTAAKSQLAAAEGQVAVDQVNLFLSLGGGWEVGGQSTPGETPPQLKVTPVAARTTAKAGASTAATAKSP
jgi:outer membrane protein TolC